MVPAKCLSAVVFLGLFIASSCQSYDASLYKMTVRADPALKRLSIELVPAAMRTAENLSTRDGSVHHSTETTYAAPLLDMTQFSDQIFDKEAIPLGKLRIELLATDYSVNWLWAVPSVGTLTLVNLLGFPCVSQTCTISLKLEVQDRNGTTLHSAIVNSSGTEYAAYYWGFTLFSCLTPNLWPGTPAVIAKAKVCALNATAQHLIDCRSEWEPLL